MARLVTGLQRLAEAMHEYLDSRGHSPGCDVSLYTGEQPCTCGYANLVAVLESLEATPPDGAGAKGEVS
jgi:hypothetical protein